MSLKVNEVLFSISTCINRNLADANRWESSVQNVSPNSRIMGLAARRIRYVQLLTSNTKMCHTNSPTGCKDSVSKF